MFLACSTNTFGHHSFWQALREIRNLGYEGVEILWDAPHEFPRSKAYAMKVRRAFFNDSGFRVVNINANTMRGYYRRMSAPLLWEDGEGVFGPSLLSRHARQRAARRAHLLSAIEAAVYLGCPSVSLTSGRLPPECLPETAWEVLEDALKTVLSWAEQKSIGLAIEYEPGLLVESREDVLRLLKRFPSPWLGVNFDVGHAVVCGESVPETIEMFGRKIMHVHVEDIRGRKHFHRIPGDGDIDFVEMARALKRVGYQGALTVELYPYAKNPLPAARRALAHLSRILHRFR